MNIKNILNKGKEAIKSGVDKGVKNSKELYELSKKRANSEIHKQRKRVALDVIDKTIRKADSNKEKMHLKASEEIVEKVYEKGGEVNRADFYKNINKLSKDQKKALAEELDKNNEIVNETDFYELSKGNKNKAKNLMENAYYEANKKAYEKYGIKYTKNLYGSKNTYEKGGEVEDEETDDEDYLDYNSISDLQSERNRLVRWSNQYGSKGADGKIKQLEQRIEYLKSNKDNKMENGGSMGSNNKNGKYLDSISSDKKSKILKNIALHYRISVSDAEAEVRDADAEMLYEYIANDQSLRMDVYNDMKRDMMAKGGEIENQYFSKTPKEVYELWDYGQKYEFFKDHFENLGTYSNSEYKRLPSKKYDELDKIAKDALIEHIKGGQYAHGGSIEDENREMVLNENNQIIHHTKELPTAIKGKRVPAWVVTKVHESASDLSDATHYMDGQKMAKGGGVDNGNKVTIDKIEKIVSSKNGNYLTISQYVEVRILMLSNKYDLFNNEENWKNLPSNLTELIEDSEMYYGFTENEIKKFLKKVNSLGYTFNYVDVATKNNGEFSHTFKPYALRKIEYAKGGGIGEEFEKDNSIGFVPMDLEEELMRISRYGAISINETINILNAIVDSGLTREELEPKLPKSTTRWTEIRDKKTKEVWSKIEKYYKGNLKGNQYFQVLHDLISKKPKLIDKFKPFRKYQKFESGGNVGINQPIWQIKNKEGKYWSRAIKDGKETWQDSPDMGYMYTYDEAKKVISSIGNKDLDIVKYDKNWYKKMEKGGTINKYKRPAYDLKTTGVYKFKTKDKEYTLISYIFERENDTEDSLEIQDELRGRLGSVIIKNSSWNKLSKGENVMAYSSKGNIKGILTRIDDTINSHKYENTEELEDEFEKGGQVTKGYQESKWLTKEQWGKWNDYVKIGKINGKKENNIFTVAHSIGASVSHINAYEIEQRTKLNKFESGGQVGDGDVKFNYMMLGRLQADCEYYLGNGNRSERVLWAGNVDDHIEEMKKIWNNLPKDSKPEWLSMEDIKNYENKMKNNKMENNNNKFYALTSDGMKNKRKQIIKSVSFWKERVNKHTPTLENIKDFLEQVPFDEIIAIYSYDDSSFYGELHSAYTPLYTNGAKSVDAIIDSDNKIVWNKYEGSKYVLNVSDYKMENGGSKMANGGGVGKVLSNNEIIKDIEFEDNTDMKHGRYDFSFSTEDSEGADILDYDGYIIESSSSSRRNDEIEWGQNVPEDWEEAEKIIINAFYEWKNSKYEDGGSINNGEHGAIIDWQNFTLNELNEFLKYWSIGKGEIEINLFAPKGIDYVKSIDYKKYGNEKLSVGDIGKQAKVTKGSENIYLDIIVYNEKNEEYIIGLYSKENHKGLKEIAQDIIVKFEKGGIVERTYSSAKTIGKESQDFKSEGIDYVGGIREWNKLTEEEQRQIIVDLEKNWERNKFEKGGTIQDAKEIFKEYEENENENNHSENIVLLAKHFGTEEDVETAKEILKQRDKQGSTSEAMNKKSYELNKRLYPKLMDALNSTKNKTTMTQENIDKLVGIAKSTNKVASEIATKKLREAGLDKDGKQIKEDKSKKKTSKPYNHFKDKFGKEYEFDNYADFAKFWFSLSRKYAISNFPNFKVLQKYASDSKEARTKIDLTTKAPTPTPKTEPKKTDSSSEPDCDDLYKQYEKRKTAQKKARQAPQKTETTKNKEKIEKVEDSLDSRFKSGKLTKNELQKMYNETKALLEKIKKYLDKL